MIAAFEFGGVNEALGTLAKILLKHGVPRNPGNQTRTCMEFPGPILMKLNPRKRHVLVEERKWNFTLPYLENLWISMGLNDLDALPGKYVKSLYNFSDDGQIWRAGYGPRIRNFKGRTFNEVRNTWNWPDWPKDGVDQLKFVVQTLRKDPFSRQAMITIASPDDDCFDSEGELLRTKDMPCTRSIQFMRSHEGKLDIHVDMRSNDLLWGASAVNWFNFGQMLEYVSAMVDIPIGDYYHKASNFHYYTDMVETVQKISEVPAAKLIQLDEMSTSYPIIKSWSFEGFDDLLWTLFDLQNWAYEGSPMAIDALGKLPPDLWRDWGMVMLWLNRKTELQLKDEFFLENIRSEGLLNCVRAALAKEKR